MHGASYRSPQRLQDSDPWEQRSQDAKAVYTDNRAFTCTADNRPEVSDDIAHGFDRDQPAVSVRRPGTMASLRRRESCSYAQDFSSPNSTITRPPRPWVNTGTTRSTSLKSFGSQNSPLHQSSVYDDDLEDVLSTGRSTAHVRSRAPSKPYRDVQLRPYGQEFEDEDDEEQEEEGGGLDEFANESGVHGHGRDQDHASAESGSRSDIEDDQVYYNALARQLTRHPYDEDEGFDIHRDGQDEEYPLSKYHRKDSILEQSDSSLTKGFQASFYKLMAHQNEEGDDPDDHDTASGSRSFRSRLGGVDASSFSFTGSAHSFTSSFRARVRLTRTKTVLRQIKQKISTAARNVMTEASKATQSVGPLLSKKSSSHPSRSRSNVPTQERPVDENHDEYNPSYYDEDAEPYFDPLAAQQQQSEYGGEHEMFQHHHQEAPIAVDHRQGRHAGRYSFSSAVATR